ncbi:hypothetical protein J8273_3540 [Carpediemonas membranifera]|uniref:Uncharacterized protein n=1 Tax=Carpediemonas membranifera TaxID=201153 RepID=A0A8J6B5E9_9EUKA|nr:hypothetical protein J8273_3540 [Carpediemonas membranifera]|eukprot:KAG9393404.1 hypothetical protein J8273_3540 [Carpediemonas membranifera]
MIALNSQLLYNAARLQMLLKVANGDNAGALQDIRTVIRPIVVQNPENAEDYKDLLRLTVFPRLEDADSPVKAALNDTGREMFLNTLRNAISADTGEDDDLPQLYIIIIFLSLMLLNAAPSLDGNSLESLLGQHLNTLIRVLPPEALSVRIRNRFADEEVLQDDTEPQDTRVFSELLNCTTDAANYVLQRFDVVEDAVMAAMSCIKVDCVRLAPMIHDFVDDYAATSGVVVRAGEDPAGWDFAAIKLLPLGELAFTQVSVLEALTMASKGDIPAAVRLARTINFRNEDIRHQLVTTLVMGPDSDVKSAADAFFFRNHELMNVDAVSQAIMNCQTQRSHEFGNTELEEALLMLYDICAGPIRTNDVLSGIADDIGLHNLIVGDFTDFDSALGSEDMEEGSEAESPVEEYIGMLQSVLSVSREQALELLREYGDVELAIDGFFGD